MKKYGIITHYYKSINYGGNLQAYALCMALKKLSIDAEQICYPTYRAQSRSIKQIYAEEGMAGLMCRIFRKAANPAISRIKKLIYRKAKKNYAMVIEARKAAFAHFNSEIIPNSSIVYDDENMEKCNELYDGFITGSDQVWNFNFFRPGYFLRFASADKKIISYAASVSMQGYKDEQSRYMKESLQKFDAVSVREASAKAIIQPLTRLDVLVTADPVLLLSAGEWEKLCPADAAEGEYIFVYFLGRNKAARAVYSEFSKRTGLKTIAVCMAAKNGRFIDSKFADVERNDASPEEFVSLIKNAKYIFTDSFHATVFSHLFHKQYFVFDKDAKKSMNARIVDITKLFGAESHYCKGVDRATIEYVLAVEDIDYSKDNEELQHRIELSYKFLKDNLG